MRFGWTLDRHTIWKAIVYHWRWVGVYLFLNVLDSLTTYIGLQQGAAEMNPLATSLMGVSFSLSTIVKFIVALLAIVIAAIINHRRMFILKLMTLGIGVVVCLNLFAVLRYGVWGIQHATGTTDPATFSLFIAAITGASLAAYVLGRAGKRLLDKRRHHISIRSNKQPEVY